MLLLALVMIATLIKASAVAAAILADALWPERVERVRERVASRPIRYLVLGLLDAVAAFFVAAILGQIAKPIPSVGIVLMLWLLAVAAILVLGFAGVYGAVGQRLGERAPVLRGGAAVEIAAMLPLVGWVGHLAMACIALGAGTAELLANKAPERVPDVSSPMPDA